MDRFQAFGDYYAKNPPVHVMLMKIGQVLGVKPPEGRAAEDAVADLERVFPGGAPRT